jgi:hypothetical protein
LTGLKGAFALNCAPIDLCSHCLAGNSSVRGRNVSLPWRGIDAMGFNQDQKMVSEGSNFTIVHNDLAPGAVVKFNVALKDGTKQVKFVKVVPSWFVAAGLAAPSV